MPEKLTTVRTVAGLRAQVARQVPEGGTVAGHRPTKVALPAP